MCGEHMQTCRMNSSSSQSSVYLKELPELTESLVNCCNIKVDEANRDVRTDLYPRDGASSQHVTGNSQIYFKPENTWT